jgi:DNA-binding MarR family transcriptional regulator
LFAYRQSSDEASVTATATVAMDEETVNRLRNAVMRIGRRLRTASADEGLTTTQSGVLAILVRKGPMRAGDLAEAEAINPTLLSRVLGHLEEAGLVARGADPEDARCTLVSATPAGTRLLGRLRARRAALLAAGLEGLAPDRLAALRAALPALEDLAREGERP